MLVNLVVVVVIVVVVIIIIIVAVVVAVVGGERGVNHSNKTTLHCIGLYLKVLRMSAASMLSKASMLSCSTEWRRTFSLMWPSSL